MTTLFRLICIAMLVSALGYASSAEVCRQANRAISEVGEIHDAEVRSAVSLTQKLADMVTTGIDYVKDGGLRHQYLSAAFLPAEQNQMLQKTILEAIKRRSGYEKNIDLAAYLARFDQLSKSTQEDIADEVARSLRRRLGDRKPDYLNKSTLDALKKMRLTPAQHEALVATATGENIRDYMLHQVRNERGEFVGKVFNLNGRSREWRAIRESGVIDHAESPVTVESFGQLGILQAALKEELISRGFKDVSSMREAMDIANSNPETLKQLAEGALKRVLFGVDLDYRPDNVGNSGEREQQLQRRAKALGITYDQLHQLETLSHDARNKTAILASLVNLIRDQQATAAIASAKPHVSRVSDRTPFLPFSGGLVKTGEGIIDHAPEIAWVGLIPIAMALPSMAIDLGTYPVRRYNGPRLASPHDLSLHPSVQGLPRGLWTTMEPNAFESNE